MRIQTCNDQPFCTRILAMEGILDKIVPSPGKASCAAIHEINKTTWLVIENDGGVFTLHMLEEATQADAWEHLDAVSKGRRPVNMRPIILDIDKVSNN